MRASRSSSGNIGFECSVNQAFFPKPVVCVLANFSPFCSVSRIHSNALHFFLIRDDLKRHYTLGEYWVEVEMEDLASFDEDLSDCLYKLPTENLPLVSLRLTCSHETRL